MGRLNKLQDATNKIEFADVLGVKPAFLTNVLYRIRPEHQYAQFKIPKKTGGERLICAPIDKLKTLQKSLSNLLLDCVDEINNKKYPLEAIKYPNLRIKHPKPLIKKSTLAHGFVRNRSIITNAMMHINNKNVLNIDLEDFFDSFNFGRVRGFFIKNRNFELHEDIATVIAQIACHENKLPQGSPCSPVITNLISHSLDIRLASLAKANSCTYSRYADDITFSTRKSEFPKSITYLENGYYKVGKKLSAYINKSGFSVNLKKTRVQYKDSRQDVTGLVVNKKPNVKKEYWQLARLQCHRLFQTGTFVTNTSEGEEEGNINELEGRLNFIDQVDRFNRLRPKKTLNPKYAIKDHKKNTKALLSGREKVFSRFLFYRLFYNNERPILLTEGHTDNIYLKSAISRLVKLYPRLAKQKSKDSPYELWVSFLEYSKRTKFLLELSGGTPYLSHFINEYSKCYDYYNAPKPRNPVIIFLDNDKGLNDSGIEGLVKRIKQKTIYPNNLKSDDYRKADFIHLMYNLYLVLTPLGKSNEQTDIEYFFGDDARKSVFKGKCFNSVTKRDEKVDLSKDSFANHIVKAKKNEINFDGGRSEFCVSLNC